MIKLSMRLACILSFLLCLCAVDGHAQQRDPEQPTLTVRSTLVQVPALVKTRQGEVVFELRAEDFILTDNGVPQHPTLDKDTDSRPLALAIVVETGGAGARHFADYRRLDVVLEALIGNVEHRVAVVGFDSVPHLLAPFTNNASDASLKLANLREGDRGAAILDALAFATTQLQAQPTRYRRAILLLSETIDHGSNISLNDALRLISDTNTIMYSFGFSSTKSDVSHEASKLSNSEPGPVHGCFSRDGADAEYEDHYSSQVLDCISTLAPPLRLATMAFLASRDGLRTKTAESIAHLTGGEFFQFHNSRDLKAGLIALSNEMANYYVLSFRPTSLTPGLHALHLELKDHPDLAVKSRSEYWLDSDSSR
ncbi:MAG: VWA domain-containing protein [Terracidiphilus sp.]